MSISCQESDCTEKFEAEKGWRCLTCCINICTNCAVNRVHGDEDNGHKKVVCATFYREQRERRAEAERLRHETKGEIRKTADKLHEMCRLADEAIEMVAHDLIVNFERLLSTDSPNHSAANKIEKHNLLQTFRKFTDLCDLPSSSGIFFFRDQMKTIATTLLNLQTLSAQGVSVDANATTPAASIPPQLTENSQNHTISVIAIDGKEIDISFASAPLPADGANFNQKSLPSTPAISRSPTRNVHATRMSSSKSNKPVTVVGAHRKGSVGEVVQQDDSPICHHCKQSFSSPMYRRRHQRHYCQATRRSRTLLTDKGLKTVGMWKGISADSPLLASIMKRGADGGGACPICMQYNSRLKRHVRSVHLNERAHFCDSCDTSFPNISNLYRHMRSVHKQIPRKKSLVFHVGQPSASFKRKFGGNKIGKKERSVDSVYLSPSMTDRSVNKIQPPAEYDGIPNGDLCPPVLNAYNLGELSAPRAECSPEMEMPGLDVAEVVVDDNIYPLDAEEHVVMRRWDGICSDCGEHVPRKDRWTSHLRKKHPDFVLSRLELAK